MIAITTVTSSTGLPISPIPGDVSPGEILGSVLPSVYGGSAFSLTLSFEVTDELTNYDVLSVTSTVDLSSIGISVDTLSSSTVLISGTAIGVFPGEFYKFLLRSGTEVLLPPNNTQDWVTVTAWGIPTVIETSTVYQFNVTYDNLGTTATISTSSQQSFFWNFDSSLNTFKTLLSEGEF